MSVRLRAARDALPTPALLQECERAGIRVSTTQLTRWAKHGWMPRPVRRGRGRGQGTAWMWDAECIPRAILVAWATSPRHDSRLRIARVLIGGGYSVPSGDIRALVIEQMDITRQVVAKRQSYLHWELGAQSKRQRLDEMVHRKLRGYPSPIVAATEAVCEAIARVAPARGTTVYDEAARVLSPDLWHQLLDALPDEGLSHLLTLSFQLWPVCLRFMTWAHSRIVATAPDDVAAVLAAVPPLMVPLHGRLQPEVLRFMGREETTNACQLMASLYLALTVAGAIAMRLGTAATQPIVDAINHLVEDLGAAPLDMDTFMDTDDVNTALRPMADQMQVLRTTISPVRGGP